MKSIRIILMLLLFACANVATAQKLKTIKGEYIYYAPSNISLDEAKHTAIEKAKIEALSNEFGTTLSQSTSTVIQSANGKSNSQMVTMAEQHVKGEWIETVGEPELKISYEQDMLVISIKITGKARELKPHKLDLKVKVLRNTTDLVGESDIFTDGDRFYIYFRSPLSGYVAIYMEEDATQNVSCLLPYMHSNEGSYKVEANTDYTFFKKQSGFDSITDEYDLFTEGSVDYETIYVIFSPNAFYKANANASENMYVPMQLTHRQFMEWLMKNEAEDKDLVVTRKHIEVRKK